MKPDNDALVRAKNWIQEQIDVFKSRGIDYVEVYETIREALAAYENHKGE